MIELLNCDCIDYMKGLKDKCFDLAIVDPNYTDFFSTKMCTDNKAKKGNYDLAILNGNVPTEVYWNELFRVSKNQIIWGANWYGKYFGAGGICWFKDNTGNYSPCEYAYQSINNHINHVQIRWNGMLQQDMKNKEVRIHPTQKPIRLYKWVYNNYATFGDKILDTHGGSFSNAIAAYDLGFDLTIMEIDEDYYKAGKERFDAHVAKYSPASEIAVTKKGELKLF